MGQPAALEGEGGVSDTIESLQARVRELEGQLAAGVREHRHALVAIDIASTELAKLKDYLEPSVAREAILGVLAIAAPDSQLAYCDAADRTWRHVVPAYKVDECVEAALRALRGDR